MNLAATMSLNASGFTNPLAGVRKELGSALGSIKHLLLAGTGVGAALAAFKSGEAIVENFFAAFDKGHELEKLSRVTGESIKDLFILQKAMTAAGVDSGGLQQQLVMLQKSLGGVNEQGEPTRAIFDQLGLSIDSLQKMKAPEQLEAIGAKLRALPNAAQRTAAAMAIFGRSGAEMLAVLGDPNALKDAMESGAQLGDIYQRNAKIFSEIVLLQGQIKNKAKGLFAGMAEGAAPAVKAILTEIKKIDLTSIGVQIGTIFKAVTEAFKEGKLSNLIALSLKVGFSEGANAISQVFTGMAAGLGSLLDTLPGYIMGSLHTLIDPDFWKGIGKLALGGFESIGGALLNLFMKPITYLQAGMDTVVGMLMEGLGKIPKVGKMLGLDGFKAGTFKENLDDRKKNGFFLKDAANESAENGARNVLDGVDLINKSTKGYRDAAVKLVESFVSSFKDGFKDGKVLDTTEMRAALVKMVDGLAAKLPGEAAAKKENDTGGGLLGVGKAGTIDADRLAKIGGFIGGAGGPALDFARRTAVGVEKTATGILQMLKLPALNITTANLVGAYA
ncbi:MAG TPA: hypothetical protein VL357_06050 [Rariglobus sp.]|jgi:hypothetical protein|nr:hypothetical protein [Rariglobus sp.]